MCGHGQRRGHGGDDTANHPEAARRGFGEARLLQPAAHGGLLFFLGAILLHVLEHGRDILALLGLAFGRGGASPTRLAARIAKCSNAFLGLVFAADKDKRHAPKREREQDGDRDDH